MCVTCYESDYVFLLDIPYPCLQHLAYQDKLLRLRQVKPVVFCNFPVGCTTAPRCGKLQPTLFMTIVRTFRCITRHFKRLELNRYAEEHHSDSHISVPMFSSIFEANLAISNPFTPVKILLSFFLSDNNSNKVKFYLRIFPLFSP